MAKVVKKSNIKVAKKLPSPFLIYWEKSNYLLLIIGLMLLILGFFAMSIGSWDSFSSLVISPIILFIAYVLIFPIAILYRKKSKSENEIKNSQ
jgi:ATP/ADP translocase